MNTLHVLHVHPDLLHLLKKAIAYLVVTNFPDWENRELGSQQRLYIVCDDVEFAVVLTIDEVAAAALLSPKGMITTEEKKLAGTNTASTNQWLITAATKINCESCHIAILVKIQSPSPTLGAH